MTQMGYDTARKGDLGGEGEAALLLVLGEDHGADLLTLAQHLCHISDVIVRNLRDVEEAGDAADVDEGSVRLDRSHNAL